ncbi:hypothetical protein H5410_059887 [Solanum commersonii]|uniref:Uncharacterized protein n=1 Tax=Solanum commersonii TaxID=4109 RepID=A0A9J5W3Z8_SOLCO|nr:hypothetical protein H5410_059887 [Solanum commersonii]
MLWSECLLPASNPNVNLIQLCITFDAMLGMSTATNLFFPIFEFLTSSSTNYLPHFGAFGTLTSSCAINSGTGEACLDSNSTIMLF